MENTAELYQRAKIDARAEDPAVRKRLAEDPHTPPELLYFLTDDPDPDIRRALAGNAATPHQADLILAKDSDYGVRCMLARKFVGEGLAPDARAKLWRMGFTILETLATDGVVRVRKLLAEGLKSLFDAPREIILTLARDQSEEVAGPILRDSPVLTEGDLVDIAASGAPAWACQAIRERGVPAPRLEAALVRAAQHTAAPPAALPPDGAEPGDGGGAATATAYESREEAASRARALHAAGRLDQAALAQALEANRHYFVSVGLALCAGLRYSAVRRILTARAAKPVTALVWKAGFSMRFAMDVQKSLAHVPPREILNARYGLEYPLSDGAMEELLNLYRD